MLGSKKEPKMSHAKRNWSQYNQSLVNRGSINLWIDHDVFADWMEDRTNLRKRGRPRFSKELIKVGLVLKSVYRLTYRSLQGFLSSIFKRASPNYSLFCKRAAEVAKELPKLSNRRPTELIIDSSGLKVCGEGEWKVKVHGQDQRRRWVKMHIAIDAATQEIIATEITDSSVGDSTMLPVLVESSPKSVRSVLADGAYEGTSCRHFLHHRGLEAKIPPRINGLIKENPVLAERNDAITIIQNLGGGLEAKKLWKKLVGYHRRSLVETAFSRIKRLFGDRLLCRKFTNQVAEALVRCHVLNRMTRALVDNNYL